MTMNSGRASSSCVVRMFQAYWGSSLSSGMLRKSASISVPVMASVQPDPHAAGEQAEQDPNMATTMISNRRVRPGHSTTRCRPACAVLERQAEQRLDQARQELQGQQDHAEGDGGLRDPNRRLALDRGLAREAEQVKLTMA